MKRFLFFTFIIVKGVLCHSQEKNIYIFYDRNSPVDILNNEKIDSPLEIFKFNLNKGYLSNELSVEKDGTLVKKVRVENNNNHYLTLRYESNGENKPIIVKQSELRNTLFPNEITAVDYDNLITVLKKYDDIYIVNLEKCEAGYCIARKVVLLHALEKL